MVTTMPKTKLRSPKTRTISWATFQKKYLIREDTFKYEWVNGRVEKSVRAMNEKQPYILVNLLDYFNLFKIKNNLDGHLLPEVDTFFNKNHRRPDIAFFTREQVKAAREGKTKLPPQFVIEVISSKDQMNLVHSKMKDYRAAKVQVIWHIFPELQEVHVYKGLDMHICLEDDKCSAEPVLKGFQISPKDIFK